MPILNLNSRVCKATQYSSRSTTRRSGGQAKSYNTLADGKMEDFTQTFGY
jgi:hypothetical protein